MFEINLKKKKNLYFMTHVRISSLNFVRTPNYLDSKKSALNWFDIEETQTQQTQNQDQTWPCMLIAQRGFP